MSVNQPRSQKCKIDGCARSATYCGLCHDHWNLAWAEYQEARAVAAEEDTQPVVTFDCDCARAFDAGNLEVYKLGDDPHHAAPSHIIPSWYRNGRTR